MKLNCKIKLFDREKGSCVEPDVIIDEVKKNVKKYWIRYKNGKSSMVDSICQLNTEDEISSEIKGGGLYFILSSDGEKLLYVGKSKNLRARLRQHLVKCSESTYSHIQDVCKYLQEKQESQEELSLSYCVVNTTDNTCNATIEGALIDYILNKKSDTFLEQCWNKRNE